MIRGWAMLAAATALACVAATAGAQEAAGGDAAALRAELEAIRGQLPTHAHVMADVEYHFANLWFAAREKRWDLAGFYLSETRGRMNWVLRLRPVRKLASGQDIDLRPLVQAFDHGSLAPIRASIEAHDRHAFEQAYRAALVACHGCHVAIEKPFLEPHVPRHAPAPLMLP